MDLKNVTVKAYLDNSSEKRGINLQSIIQAKRIPRQLLVLDGPESGQVTKPF